MEFDLVSLQDSLRNLPLGGILFFSELSSTNDYCLSIPQDDIRDLMLVITNYQMAGRGRKNNRWISPRNSSLTFSLILLPSEDKSVKIGEYTALGALAVIRSINKLWPGVEPLIKWPNDILIGKKKICGVLSEVSWLGEKPERIVIGIGINISNESISSNDQFSYPATCLENEIGKPVDKLELLELILEEIIKLRGKIRTAKFISDWENNLAFRGQQVNIIIDNEKSKSGVLLGLNKDGSLRLLDENNSELIIQYGTVHLRSSF